MDNKTATEKLKKEKHLKDYNVLYKDNQELIKSSARNIPFVNAKHLKNLKQQFGYTSFRPLQWKIINALVNKKRDVCAVLAPGYGRSLCYLYPTLCAKAKVLVISPLTYKIEEEIHFITISSVSALLLNSVWSEKETIDENHSIIYINSDVFSSYENSPLLKQMDFTLIVVDEAHCISRWGYEFRNSYRKFQTLKVMFPNIPLLALTSCPCSQVRDDIVEEFQMSDPLIACSSFYRPNLKFEVDISMERSIQKRLEKLHINPSNWKRLFSESTVIYVETCSSATIIAKELEESGIPCLEYHESLYHKNSKYPLECFLRDEIKVLVVSVSHGLSIYKPDIRNIIHFFCPRDIESYYQEIGIGGRDGLSTRCIVLCFPSDLDLVPYYVRIVVRQFKGLIKKRKTHLMELMHLFLNTTACRTLVIKLFDGITCSDFEHNKSECCDNCLHEYIKNDSAIYHILGLNEEGKYNVEDDFWKFVIAARDSGTESDICSVASNLASSSVAATSCKSARWWEGIGQLLITKGLIEDDYTKQHNSSYPSGINPKTWQLFVSNYAACIWETPNLLMYKELLHKKYPTRLRYKSMKYVEDPPPVYTLLLEKRLELAKLCECACFTIATDEVLQCLAATKPKTFSALQSLELNGFGKHRLEMFGKDFLSVMTHNDYSWFDFCNSMQCGKPFYAVRQRNGIPAPLAFEYFAIGIRNGFLCDWPKFGITDAMKAAVGDVILKYENMFMTSIPDWNAAEDLKRFSSLYMRTEKILLIWTYLQQMYNLNLNLNRDKSVLSLSQVLFVYPVSAHIPSADWYLLSLLATSATEVTKISELRDLQESTIWESIAVAITKGHEVILSAYNADQEMKKAVALQLTQNERFKNYGIPNYFCARHLSRSITHPKKTQGVVLLIWTYLYVRMHLLKLNVQFYDHDPLDEELQCLLKSFVHEPENRRRCEAELKQPCAKRQKTCRNVNCNNIIQTGEKKKDDGSLSQPPSSCVEIQENKEVKDTSVVEEHLRSCAEIKENKVKDTSIIEEPPDSCVEIRKNKEDTSIIEELPSSCVEIKENKEVTDRSIIEDGQNPKEIMMV